MNKIPDTKKALQSQSRESAYCQQIPPTVYVGTWIPLASKREEISLCDTDSGARLAYVCDEPLKSAPEVSKSLAIDRVERNEIVAEVKALLDKHSFSSGGTVRYTVRDPVDFCLSICNEDTDVFLRVFGLQGSPQCQQLRRSVLSLLKSKFD